MIVGSIVYSVLCLISLASDVGRPFPGFLTYYNVIHTRMEIEWNTPSWWWDTTGGGLLLSDVLIQVDETPFHNIKTPVNEAILYQTLWEQGKTFVNITVKRNNNLVTFTMPVKIFSWVHYNDLILMPLIQAASYMLLAIILYRTANGSKKQRLVILVLCAIALLGLAVRGSLFIFGGWRENLLLFINPLHSIIVTFLGAILIHLAFHFPFLRWPRLARPSVPFIYTLAATLYTFTNTTIIFLQSLADVRYLSLVIPLAFAAISLRYHTFAGAEKWLVLVSALAVSGFLSNAGVTILFWQSPQILRELPFPPTVVLFLLFLVISLLWGLQSDWQGWLGRVFHWDRVGYNEARRFGQMLSNTSYDSAAQLSQQITAVLRKTLSVESAALWLTTNNSHIRLQAHDGSHTPPEELCPPPNLPLQPIPLRGNTPEWLQSMPPHTAVILPMSAAGRQLGLLAVGKRWDSAVFDDRDLEILDLIAQQAALFLHNARQIEQVRAADKQMLQIQENARRQVAQDLHDYILPTLSQLPLTLQTGLNYLETAPEKTRPLLEQSIERLEENASRIRRIQQNLVIRPLQYGLSIYLEEMVQRFQQDTGITLALTLPPNLDETIPDRASRELIYAVWQQALDNIQAHARASRVKITLTLTEHTVQFSICDDGIGVSQEQLDRAKTNGRFGLRSMQTRLKSVGGQFDFQSTPGRGSCVTGTIPTPTNTPVPPPTATP